MSAAMTLVRLRWTLTLATLRKSVWQTIAYVLSAVLAVGVIISVGIAAWFIGGFSGSPLIRTIIVLIGAVMTLMVGFMQLMMLGEGSTMSPRKFALYGIADRDLQFGLLVSGLSGIPAITGVISLMLWSLAYRFMGAGVVIAAMVAAPLAIITMMSVSKLLISASTTLVTSKRGKNVFYVAVILLFITICQLPNILVNSGVSAAFDPAAWDSAATIMAWTPLGAAFQLPFDVATGDWLALIARIVILAVTWVVCFMICTWCLRRERLTVGASGPAVTLKGIGSFSWMPDSASGAVSARLLIYMRRDPRLAMLFAMPVFFVVIFALQSHGMSVLIWQSLIWCGWFMSVTESNGLAYDGRGFTMEVISGVRGWTDRLGRVRVYVGIVVVYMLVLYAASIVLIGFTTGAWARPDDLLTGVMFLSIGMAVAFCGIGLAEIVSCVFMYPVPSLDKPFSSPQGRAMAQGFFPFIYIFGSLLLMLPTGIGALILLICEAGSTAYLLLIPVSLINGIGMLVLGSWLGGKLLDARMLSIVRTLDSFASLQK
jgi:ABC-2 type transport system permease protein